MVKYRLLYFFKLYKSKDLEWILKIYTEVSLYLEADRRLECFRKIERLCQTKSLRNDEKMTKVRLQGSSGFYWTYNLTHSPWNCSKSKKTANQKWVSMSKWWSNVCETTPYTEIRFNSEINDDKNLKKSRF